MSRDEIEASTIRPPRRGECRQLASTNATQVFGVPTDWNGKKVRFEAIGDDFWVQVAPDATISINPGAVDTITANALSAPSPAIGEKVSNGTYKEFDIYSADKFIGVRGTGAGGAVIAIRPTEILLGSE